MRRMWALRFTLAKHGCFCTYNQHGVWTGRRRIGDSKCWFNVQHVAGSPHVGPESIAQRASEGQDCVEASHAQSYLPLGLLSP